MPIAWFEPCGKNADPERCRSDRVLSDHADDARGRVCVGPPKSRRPCQCSTLMVIDGTDAWGELIAPLGQVLLSIRIFAPGLPAC